MRVFVLCIAMVCAVPDRPDPIPGDARPLPEEILGEWHVVTRLKGGMTEDREAMNWVFTKEEMQHIYLRNGGRVPASKFLYTLDAAKRPAVIVFTAASYAGILKVEGNIMTICLHPSSDKQPPPDFVSPPGSQASLLRLTRVRR